MTIPDTITMNDMLDRLDRGEALQDGVVRELVETLEKLRSKGGLEKDSLGMKWINAALKKAGAE
jgi:hypothetical protein